MGDKADMSLRSQTFLSKHLPVEGELSLLPKKVIDIDEQVTKRLIVEIKSGDTTAFTRLIKLHSPNVRALAYKLVRDNDEASDIVQMVYVKISQNISRYDTSKRFSTWLYRITFNAAIDYVRRQKRHRHESLESHNNDLVSTVTNPEYAYSRVQLQKFMSQAIKSLDEPQLKMFTLRFVEGCRVSDVARIVGLPVTTVRWCLLKAKQRLMHELRKSHANSSPTALYQF